VIFDGKFKKQTSIEISVTNLLADKNHLTIEMNRFSTSSLVNNNNTNMSRDSVFASNNEINEEAGIYLFSINTVRLVHRYFFNSCRQHHDETSAGVAGAQLAADKVAQGQNARVRPNHRAAELAGKRGADAEGPLPVRQCPG